MNIPKEMILVIEDDFAIRESLKEILLLNGYEVNTAKNGQEGLSAIVRENTTLVICDVNMPIMGGFELLKKLNDNMKKEVIPPFLFLTARVANSDMRIGMELGADDYMTKPFNYIDLLANVALKIKKRKRIQSVCIAEEQNRISNELHDSIQQLLAAAQIGFNSIEGNITFLDLETEEMYSRSRKYLKDAAMEVRTVSHDMSVKEEINLKEKIGDLMQQLKKASKIETHFTYQENKILEDSVKFELLRITQEAVNNIIKYANAKSITLHIESNNDGGKIEITDNGKGFDLNNHIKGKGLTNIGQRAKKIKASLHIISSPNKGTSISINW
jgi:signal transduction histidine kinase